MKKHYVEFLSKYTPEFLEKEPEVFDNESDGYAELCLEDMYGSLYFEDETDKKPIFFIRHAGPEHYRFGGFVELGDDYLMPQKGGYHHDDIAQKGTLTTGYGKISDTPAVYGIGSASPYSEYRFYPDHATFKEGDFFDVTAAPIGFCMVDHGVMLPPLSQICQPCLIKGTYEGRQIVGLGEYDRVYMPKKIKSDIGEILGYICSGCSGIREDGGFEAAAVCIDEKGTSYGYYWLEGQEPVVSHDVKMEAEWVHLPYTDDGTCIYKDAIFRFSDIEFHFEGKWGTKGFTKNPRVERHGQSQVFGTWYVGKTPYKHKLSTSFNENMEAYDHKLKKQGFKVLDQEGQHEII